MCQMKGGRERVNDTEGLLAHQEEGESGESHPGSGEQRCLYRWIVIDLPGGMGELTEPLLWDKNTRHC